jgi:hypothetical protein
VTRFEEERDLSDLFCRPRLDPVYFEERHPRVTCFDKCLPVVPLELEHAAGREETSAGAREACGQATRPGYSGEARERLRATGTRSEVTAMNPIYFPNIHLF